MPKQKILIAIMFLNFGFCVQTAWALPALPADRTWQLTFEDEFSGTNLDTTKWNYGMSEVPWCPDCPTGPSIDNLIFDNGILKINPPSYQPKVDDVYVGGMTSYSHFSQRYGYFEMRYKITVGNGLWSAFWMLPVDLTQMHAEHHREIDIFEILGYDPNGVIMTIHDYENLASPSQSQTYYGSNPTIYDDYHTIGYYWPQDSNEAIWYVDDVEQKRAVSVNNWTSPMYILVFQSCMYVDWGPDCDETTPRPGTLYVDYVRAYKVVSSDTDTTPPSAPINVSVE